MGSRWGDVALGSSRSPGFLYPWPAEPSGHLSLALPPVSSSRYCRWPIPRSRRWRPRRWGPVRGMGLRGMYHFSLQHCVSVLQYIRYHPFVAMSIGQDKDGQKTYKDGDIQYKNGICRYKPAISIKASISFETQQLIFPPKYGIIHISI